MALHTARAGGWVTNMWEKIIRAVGDVGVPAFWLDPTWPALIEGEGSSLFKERTFYGNYSRPRHATSPGAKNKSMPISRSIPAARSPRRLKTGHFKAKSLKFSSRGLRPRTAGVG